MQALSRVERRATCFHEAGHAVVFALGGVAVTRVAVAPEGATEWRTPSSNGRTCSDLWGLCVKAELVLPRQLLRWLMSEGALSPDGSGYAKVLESPEGQALVEALGPRQRRDIRAQMAGLLAGPLAERIFRGEAAQATVEAGPGDGAKARALAALLGDPAEFAHAARLAEAALRGPARWAQVGALAAALEAAGHVEAGIRGFLPAADPAWPPAPSAAGG